MNARMSATDMRLILTTAQLEILLSAHPCVAPHPWLLRDLLWLASRGLRGPGPTVHMHGRGPDTSVCAPSSEPPGAAACVE